MSDATTRRPVPDYQGSTWASGLSVFAASLMMVLGVFQFFEGLVAVVDGNDFLLNTKNYVVQFDASTAGSVSPSANAFNIRRALTPNRSDTKLDNLMCPCSNRLSNWF